MDAVHFTHDWRNDICDFLRISRLPLIVVLGPTASGKTGLSIEMAHHVLALRSQSSFAGRAEGKLDNKGKASEIEIVNADSRQLYKYMDIGTAKITPGEMQGVTHHLLSVLDPREESTIAWYQKEALRIIRDIHLRGNVPMLVGGSMLYISAIIDGLRPMGAVDLLIKQQLEQEYDRDGGISLHARLARVDPTSAAGIPRQNKVYLVRAMEIFESTGASKYSQLRTETVPYDLLLFGVHRERADLMNRINLRTHAMLGAGWIDEVRALLVRGYTAYDPGMKSHGYTEIIAALQEGKDPWEVESFIAARSRQYAKRQMTWWRGDERIRWIHYPCG